MTLKRGGNSTQSSAPLVLIVAGLMIILGILLWQDLSVPKLLVLSPTPTTSNIPYPNVARLSLLEAKAAFDQKTAVFVDVRDIDSYKAGHIPGALNIPLADFDNPVKVLETAQWIIAYCT